MRLKDDLSDTCADLVSEKQYDLFIQRLFAVQAGLWIRTVILCTDIVQMEERIIKLEERSKGHLLVTWLSAPEDPDFCTIIFFEDRLIWSTIAVFNKKHFLSKVSSSIVPAK